MKQKPSDKRTSIPVYTEDLTRFNLQRLMRQAKEGRSIYQADFFTILLNTYEKHGGK